MLARTRTRALLNRQVSKLEMHWNRARSYFRSSTTNTLSVAGLLKRAFLFNLLCGPLDKKVNGAVM